MLNHLRDPAVRYRFHVVMAAFWLVTMIVVPFVLRAELVPMLILEISLYANFSTEFGAMDSSKASDQTEPPMKSDCSVVPPCASGNS